jgi:hypothetical protein
LKALKVHTRRRILENPVEKEDFVNPLLPTFLKAVRHNVLLLSLTRVKLRPAKGTTDPVVFCAGPCISTTIAIGKPDG